MENKKSYKFDEAFEASKKYFDGDEMAAATWVKKYSIPTEEGEFTELTPDDMHRRMARLFSEVEDKYEVSLDDSLKLKLSEYGYNRGRMTEEEIYDLFKDFKYIIPAGSVMSGLGNPLPVSLSNCWVIKGPEDSLEDIFRVCNEQSQLMKRRGGVGFDISGLRPNGSIVHNSAKMSTGAASFMDLFSNVTNTISQCGRRGALLLSISVSHPDALEFTEKKQDLTKVTGANVSVQIDDEFMKAVENNSDFYQHWPVDSVYMSSETKKEDMEYGKLYPCAYADNVYSSAIKTGGYIRRVKAKELWDQIIHCAWNTAEPGILFSSRHHNYSPDSVYPQFKGTSTNPCLAGDTLIEAREIGTPATIQSSAITIKDIVDGFNKGKEYFVLTCGANGEEWCAVINAFLTKKDAEVVKVEYTTEAGFKSSIRLTPDHKVFCKNEWVEAKDLKPGDALRGGVVESVTPLAEREDVYDLQVENHNFFANGILVHNCGEIFMHEDSCRLIHVNLSSVIENPFTDKARIDDEKLYEITYEAMRLADDLVDLEANSIGKILSKIESDGDKGNTEYKLYKRLLENSLAGRRCGLGFLALSDAIAMLGYKYDSDEGTNAVRHIMRVMFKAEMDCQIDMAITRGAFPAFDKNVEKVGNDWYKMLETDFPELAKKNAMYGRRNVSFNTVAPTGTVALMARRSSGIEPVFMPYYTRRVKCMNPTDRVDFVDQNGEKFTEYVVVHPTLKEWAETKYGSDFSDDWTLSQWEDAYKASPWFGSTAQEIDWKKRVELQSAVQQRITHSISSTVNLPNNVTEEEVSTIYMNAWKSGLKGITVYRDGCRSGVMVSAEKKEEEKPKEVIASAKRRPKSLDCKIFRFSNKGEKWVGVVGMMDGEPYEIFTGMLDKLNIPNWVEEGVIVKNYEMIKDSETGEEKRQSRYDLCYEDKDGYRVCLEGLSRTFNSEYWNYAKLISGLLRHHMSIEYVIKVISTLKLDSSTINTWKNGVIRTLRKFQNSKDDESAGGETCPQCGGRLVRDGGCIHCIDCGWSRCE